jgi:hypothetical protein
MPDSPSTAAAAASAVSPRVRRDLISEPTPTDRSFEKESPNATAASATPSPDARLPRPSPTPTHRATSEGTTRTDVRLVRSLRKSKAKSRPSETG